MRPGAAPAPARPRRSDRRPTGNGRILQSLLAPGSILGADPVEQTTAVVRDDEAAVRRDHHAGRSAPALAAGILPTGDEVMRRNRLSVLEIDQQQLRRGRWLPVRGA